MNERKWNGLYVSVLDMATYDDVGVYVSDEELDDVLYSDELAEYFAREAAKYYINDWNAEKESMEFEEQLLVGMLESLKKEYEDRYAVRTIDNALEKMAEMKENPIDVVELTELLLDFVEISAEGEWEFDDEEDQMECPYEIGFYWDGGLEL